jgi:UTP--glucose-1-phosphate uridylyltransferase
MEVKKAIIPIAGLGTRFLPLSKILPKELWPLVDKPVLQYIVQEAVFAGIKEIIFVTSPEKKAVAEYFSKYLKKNYKLENILRSRSKHNLLKELQDLESILNQVSFKYINQKKPLGDGHAILQAKTLIDSKPFAVLFGDDVVVSKKPCLAQLMSVFKEYRTPVIALYEVLQEKLPSYGVVSVRKIKNHLYKIKDIIEKPEIKKAPSRLAIVGKYILTPDVFNHLKKSGSVVREIILADALREMIKAGKNVLGLQFEGKWLECGNKLAYLKSNLYLSLKHPQFGKELKKHLKEI